MSKNCWDCIHCDVCANIDGFSHHVSDVSKCKHFKDKADVEPVKHGKWLNFYGNYETAECSVCEELYEVSDMKESNRMLFEAFSQYYKYCPHCGAKMEGKEVQE